MRTTQSTNAGGEALTRRHDRQANRRSDRGRPNSASDPVGGYLGEVGRYDLCPCGSGKKYKHCHGTLAQAE